MFTDKRSKKIILVSHCLLNQNSISDGTADFPSQFQEIVSYLMSQHIGIIQLPCPELLCLGLDRGDPMSHTRPLLQENTRIREKLSDSHCLDQLNHEADKIIQQIEEYKKHGFRVLGLIGVNRSPSCGIDSTTRDGVEVQGKGVFAAVLSEALSRHGIVLPMSGIKTSEIEDSIAKVHSMLGG